MGQRIGEMKCTNPLCSCTDVAVEVTSAGNWQSRCHKCLKHTYSKAGTKWRRDMEQLVTLDEAPGRSTSPEPERSTLPEPERSTLPEKRKPNPARPPMSAFNLADL